MVDADVVACELLKSKDNEFGRRSSRAPIYAFDFSYTFALKIKIIVKIRRKQTKNEQHVVAIWYGTIQPFDGEEVDNGDSDDGWAAGQTFTMGQSALPTSVNPGNFGNDKSYKIQ